MSWRQRSGSGVSWGDSPSVPSREHAGQQGSTCVAGHTETTRVKTREATR